jgi:cytochrome P450
MSNYYQFFNNLRRIPPIKLKDSWLISRYDDVKYCFTEYKLFSAERVNMMFSRPDMDLNHPQIRFTKEILEQTLIHMDSEVGETKKELIRAVHTFAANGLKQAIETRFDEVRAKIKKNQEYDIRLDFIAPVVCNVTMKMVGMHPTPKTDLKTKKIYDHSEIVSILLEDLVLTPEKAITFSKSLLYLLKIDENYDGVDDDFAMEEYDLSRYSFYRIQQSFIQSTLVYSITNMVANVLKVMMDNADQIPAERVKDAIMEALRLESPVQGAVRIATEDTTLRGVPIKKGDFLTLMIGSANRDDNVPEFKDAAKFIIDRKRIPLMVFGYGHHACVGKIIAMDCVNTIIPKLWEDRFFKEKEVIWADELVGYRGMKTFIVENIPEPILQNSN